MSRLFTLVVLVILAVMIFGSGAVWSFAHRVAAELDHITSGPPPSLPHPSPPGVIYPAKATATATAPSLRPPGQ